MAEPARAQRAPVAPGGGDGDRVGSSRPSALGGYEDWASWQAAAAPLAGAAATASSGTASSAARAVAKALGVPAPAAVVPRREAVWARDGVVTERLTWHVGFGPPTTAWVVRPQDAAPNPSSAASASAGAPGAGPAPGVLLLHCHAGVKSIGGERLVTTPAPSATALGLRERLYAGRALADELARRGLVVLVHDTFAWGSRRFVLDPLPVSLVEPARRAAIAWAADGVEPDDDARYDAVAGPHEHVVAKAAGMLSTSFAGMVAHDDLAALAVLRSLPGVDPARIGVAGFSGGGGRAATLASLDDRLRAVSVLGMMTTTEALLPDHADAHSWLLTTPGLLGRHGLPELATGARGHDLQVLSFAEDPLFPPTGVRAAHARLREAWSAPGGGALDEAVLPGGHVVGLGTQERLAAFLARSLGARGPR